MEAALAPDDAACLGPRRRLRFVRGPAGRLLEATFALADDDAFRACRERLGRSGIPCEFAGGRLRAIDLEGRAITLVPAAADEASPRAEAAAPARLQHFAVQTTIPERLVDFYAAGLGFVVSDRVFDSAGHLTAAFLRTDAEHHALAIFRSAECRFDHFSCETENWEQLRDWADHMAAVGVDLAWGIGRHGPGNDTFFMVRDPDGNLGELSCDLERCPPGRPAGRWPHRPQTLNRWGVAYMRS